jgi:uncharacterized protein YtpQ (UPF0354 family)
MQTLKTLTVRISSVRSNYQQDPENAIQELVNIVNEALSLFGRS